ncbi:hypothetical protein, partial [Streptomyces sp. CC216C]|uniref:hypothetical protein n=1 Tax=Streptomyces sp. CC216C TaxID=3044576 RepID=UPI0024A9C57D
MIRTEALHRLPVRTAGPALERALDDRGVAVLCAPPGTGKTTLVPLVLAGLTGNGPVRRVLVAEPRRIAAWSGSACCTRADADSPSSSRSRC